MDYLLRATKFIQDARECANPEVIKTNLEMAEWCLSQAIKERDETGGQKPQGSPQSN